MNLLERLQSLRERAPLPPEEEFSDVCDWLRQETKRQLVDFEIERKRDSYDSKLLIVGAVLGWAAGAVGLSLFLWLSSGQ